MHSNKLFVTSILLIFAITLSGCASPATPAATLEPLAAPTTAPTSCPTESPQSCPTAALQQPVLNEWRWGSSKSANFIITFEPGDKCTLKKNNPMDGSKISFETVVNDQTYQNYLVIAVTLSEGKDFKDLEAYNQAGGENNVNPPSWSDLQVLEIVSPMSRTWQGLPSMQGPVYFICAVQGPDEQRLIQTFEGIDLPKN